MTARRQSTKRRPSGDDDLKRAAFQHPGHVETSADEDGEGLAEGARGPDADDATGLPRDPVLARRELSRHLRIGVFPATRDDLVREAGENDAPAGVVWLLERLPADSSFATVYEVWDALGGAMEPGAHEVLVERELEPETPGRPR